MTTQKPLVHYLDTAWHNICARLDVIEVSDRKADLARRLMEHDRGFSDGDSSKFNELRASLTDAIRRLNEKAGRRESEIEAYENIDYKTLKVVNKLMDAYGFDEDDPFRPARLLSKGLQWSESDLCLVDAEIMVWRGRIDQNVSTVADMFALDFKAYLDLLLRESKLTNEFYELGKQLSRRLSELWGEELAAGSPNYRATSDILRKFGLLPPDQYATKNEKLAASQCPLRFIDEQHQQVALERAAIHSNIDALRARITERAKPFLEALDAWAVPMESLIRENLRATTTEAPTPKKMKRRSESIDNKKVVHVIGSWWEETHSHGAKITAVSWEELAQQMQRRDVDLMGFLRTKPATKNYIEQLNSKLRQGKLHQIRNWSQLIAFMRQNGDGNRDLRRILHKRFSEIYNKQYKGQMTPPRTPD